MKIHAYYPTLRSAYGPRNHRPHEYVEDALCSTARELATDYAHAIEWQAMPNGGRRAYIRCVNCGRLCEKVYRNRCYGIWECRQCAGFVYWSQYDGRRIEASKERIIHYLRSGGGAYRFSEAFTIWLEREVRHDARCWASMAITQERWLRYVAKCDAWERGEVTPNPTKKERGQILQLARRWKHLSHQRKRTGSEIPDQIAA